MIRLTADVIQSLKQQHGDELRAFSLGPADVVVRRPNRTEFKRFLDRSTDEKKRMLGVEELAFSCIVLPDRQTLDTLVEQYPGMLLRAGNAALEMAGTTGEDEVQKL